MRLKSAPKVGTSVVKFAVAALLASAATSCSSDVTRFSGVFSKSDSMSTASIPQRQGAGAYGNAPVPQASLNNGQSLPAPVNGGYSGGYGQVASQQPYSGSYTSPARAATAPVSVQHAELPPPSGAIASSGPIGSRPSAPADRDPVSRREAMAQPFPGRDQASTVRPLAPAMQPSRAESLTTASTKPMSGWSTVNAPHVQLRPGETAATLARRYGVPEKEILRANNGQLQPGQQVTIPVFGVAAAPAKTAAGDIDLRNKAPAPMPQAEQKVAVLPSARDKSMAEPGKIMPAGGRPLNGNYKVRPGDSLAKIARETGTPIDQLKAANGLGAGGVRVGQTLKVAQSIQAPDPVNTASIPPKSAVEKPAAMGKPVVAAAAPAAPAKPATETASLSDVQKKADTGAAAPQSTGIDKYRWPVSGAVIAGYGANVDGNRNDGIDISVPEGTPIKAAENGVVIYAGNGLKQLGNTVLIRHDDGKVTVYGHASAIDVTRGQKVTRGQTIAESGMSGDAKRPTVHFEVRKDATPVNPTTYLE